MSLEKLEAQDRAQDLIARLGDRLLLDVVGQPAELIAQAEFREAVAAAWIMGATYAANVAIGRQPCRVCGCWELEACDGGCAWVEMDLCSVCAGPAERLP